MSGIFGLLGISDTDRSFINTLGQRAVYDASQQLLAQYNAGLQAAQAVFIERATPDFKLRYKLPGGGRLQRRGGQGPSAAGKATGEWDIALPLEDFGDQVAGDDVSLAYMTIEEYNRHLDTVFIRDRNTVRFEILKALFNNTQRSFVDQTGRGTLAIEPLANNDSVLYPPVEGSESEATENHYLESGYASASISTSNNPLVTVRNELEEHFGGGAQGGSNIIVFCNNAETNILTGLADFSKVDQRFVTAGDNTALADRGLPTGMPGKLLGYGYGVWLAEWRWIPANYLLALHLEAPKPLLMREDPAETGLEPGLALVSDDTEYPFKAAHYRHRFGLGVGNRLNGTVLELGTGGTYTIPTPYA